MDAAAHYRHLIALGRDEFLAAAAPAALVRERPAGALVGGDLATLDFEVGEHGEVGTSDDGPRVLEVFPLAKKPGASFADRITIGRTSNNDVVIGDHSVSRLHAYVRHDGARWLVADAGSKNGSWLHGSTLEPRKERELGARAALRLGDVEVTFYLAGELYGALGGAA